MDDYRQARGVNFSSFKYFLESPRLYRWRLENPEPQSKAFLLGDLVHTILLESHLVDEKFTYWSHDERPDKRYTMAAKENKLWLENLESKAEREGKLLISDKEKYLAERMTNALFTDPMAMKLYNEAHKFEQPVFWKRNGIDCKGKQDIVHKDYIADIKTTAAENPREFIYKALKYYRYDLQAAMYTDKDLTEEFYFICLPKTEPFIPYVVAVTQETLNRARKEFHQALKRLKRCQETNVWNGYGMQTM